MRSPLEALDDDLLDIHGVDLGQMDSSKIGFDLTALTHPLT